jgi:hypothetical protein
MYGLDTIKKINATEHPFNTAAREAGLHPDETERLAVLHATAQREAKNAIAALAVG